MIASTLEFISVSIIFTYFSVVTVYNMHYFSSACGLRFRTETLASICLRGTILPFFAFNIHHEGLRFIYLTRLCDCPFSTTKVELIESINCCPKNRAVDFISNGERVSC